MCITSQRRPKSKKLEDAAQMSAIESLVLEHLAKQDELKTFERGVRLQRRDGETRLWFQPTTAIADEFGLCATAFIETIFSERWSARHFRSASL
jgi:hypothetical protein